MRGPGMRLGLDVRRLWQCPQCGVQRKLPADVTSIRCSACSAPPFMQIVEPPRRPRPAPKPLNPFLTIDLDTPEEGESPGTVTAVVSAVMVETVTAGDPQQAAPTSSAAGAPPQKRDDRRNKPRRQRDRQGKPDRPPQHSASPPTPESPPAATSLPDASPPPDQPQSPSTPHPAVE